MMRTRNWEGHFEWQSPDETLWFNTTGTAIFEDVDHHVVFVPEEMQQNYKETVFIFPVRTYLKALYANLTASDFLNIMAVMMRKT